MYRVTGATMGTVAIGLVAVFLVVGMVGGGLLGASHSTSGQTAKVSPAGTAGKYTDSFTKSAGVHPSAVTVTLAFTSTFVAYETLPFAANYTLTVTGAAINNVTTTMFVNITDISSGAVLSVTPVLPAPGQTTYYYNVTYGEMTCFTAACVGLPQDEFKVSVSASNSNVTDVITQSFFLITTPLSVTVVSPTPGAAVSAGNVSLSVAYLGSYVAGGVIKVYAQPTGALVFQQSIIELTPGVPASLTWFVSQPGTYSYTITMTTVYVPNTHNFYGNLTVITKGGTVYQNTTKWSNQTVLPGLSGAAAGTLLLVVGLIVGMIVAFILASAVSRSRPVAPPQQWESKPGAAAAPNTCSVCGKSFATPEELAAHAKSEHGMQ